MRPALSTQLLATIERHGMIFPGDRVAVAVSGGGDSVALLLLLMQMREALGVTLKVAHFNHGLRPGEADEDERFVRELAGVAGLACIVHREDVAGQAQRSGSNLEAEARDRRYAFFCDLVSQGWATRVATGHTADDQAETVLARLARGSGLRGLGAIHPVLGQVVRPLIALRREELRRYLAARGQPWREDGTNWDTLRLRARIRHRLLPVWEAEFGPSGVANLARLADLARNDEALLEEVVEERFRSLARGESGSCVLEVQDLLDPPLEEGTELRTGGARQALGGRLVRRAARQVKEDLLGLTAEHVAAVLDLARRGTSGKKLELPGGLVVERVLNRLAFYSTNGSGGNASREDAPLRNNSREATRQARSYAYSADPWQAGEATVQIAETGKRLRLKLIDWPPAGRETYAEGCGVLDADRLEPPLTVRNRLPGDSYRPRGRGKKEKLKRLLLDQRIPGKDRALWPVLTSAGRLVWSSGLPVAADFAAGESTQRALIIREEPNEPGREDSFRETGAPRGASNQ